MSTNQYNRQQLQAAFVKLGIANIGTGNGVTVDLPQGAELLRISYHTVTAFDSATTTTGTVSDGTTTFVNAENVKTTGAETVANVPKYYPTGGRLTFTLAETGATATVGEIVAVVEYAQYGVCHTIQG